MIAQGRENEALSLLSQDEQSLRQSAHAIEVEFLKGSALHHSGQTDQADLVLRDLIQRIPDRGDTYAQTALELGKINLEQFRDDDAARFFQLVTTSHTRKDWEAPARLGLAECFALQLRYHQAVASYQQTAELLRKSPFNRALTATQLQQSLALLAHRLALLKKYPQALAFLEIEQQIAPENDVDAAHRFARMHDRLAQQLRQLTDLSESQTKSVEPTENEKLWLQQQRRLISAHFEQAARQYLRVASLAAQDDDLYSRSLWNAAHCYDQAGQGDRNIETLERFVDERQGQPRWPLALFNLGRAYQAAGNFDAAILAHKRLRRRHPRLNVTADAMVPLARCYLAQQPSDTDAAEEVLKTVLVNHALTPTASSFRDALFELGELYYNTARYDLAISKLTEAVDRYSDHPKIGKAMFLVGDAYHKSGRALDENLAQLAQDPAASVSHEKIAALRNDYLAYAYEYFNRAISFYSNLPAGRLSPLEQMYLRHSWLYRAECLFDLQRYSQAALAYEETVLRYQLTPTALAAFVQVVNCQLELDRPDEARSANQRALWQLRKIPDQTLARDPQSLTRQQWQQWFQWTQESGLW